MSLLEEFKNYLFSQDSKPSRVTVKNYLSDINHFSRWFENTFHKTFSPGDVTFHAIENYKNESSQNLSSSSIERHLSSLRKFFYFLKLNGQITSSPFEQIKNGDKTEADPWHIKDFKSYLYVYNASHLTIKNYLIDIKQFLRWAQEVTTSNITGIGTNVLDKINPALIEEYKQRLLTQGSFSPATVNRKLSSLRKYTAWAEAEGLIENQELRIKNYELEKKPELQQFINEAIQQVKETETNRQSYSPFPPLRLLQKVTKSINLALDATLIASLVKIIEKVEFVIWKAKGTPVFTKFTPSNLKSSFLNHKSIFNIKNIKKEFYAPLEVSTKDFPWYKKALFTLKYKRPNWYRTYHSYAITHYFHFAVLVIFAAGLVFGFYNEFLQTKSPTLAANPNLPTNPLRILSFQGRLTDNNDNPITAGTNLRFQIYRDGTATGAAILLWQEVDRVNPDVDGIFNAILGNTSAVCSNPTTVATGACAIPQSLFSENNALWLGVTVENTPELTPRQQIATVAFAANSETLQGLLPITATASGTTNVVLALNSSGNLVIGGSATPVFQATGGQFTITGQTVLLSSNAGSNGNIQLTPDGTGKIDLTKPLVNTSISNNISTARGSVEVDDLFSILATSSGQSALTINQTGGGPLISASASGANRFAVDNSGNVRVAGGQTSDIDTFSAATLSIGTLNQSGLTLGRTTTANTTIQGANFINGGVLYGLSGAVGQTGAGALNNCLLGQGSGVAPIFGNCGTGISSDLYWNQQNGSLFPNNSTVDFLFGSQASTSARFRITANNLGAGTLGVASISGKTSYATLVVNNDGVGDLFTASSSGFTRFTVGNYGQLFTNSAISATETILGTSSASLISAFKGFNGYTNFSGGIGTGGTDSILNAQRITSTGNLTNIGSIQAGELLLTTSATFSAKVDYTTGAGSAPYGVAIGDLNGDGKADMAATNSTSNSVSVFINKGDGTYNAEVDYTTGTDPRNVAIRDLNGDGKADLAVVNFDNGAGGNDVSVFINKGDGTFTGKADYTTGTNPIGIALADLNGDGKTDMAATNYTATNVSVFINKGDGTFTGKADYTTGTNPIGIALADLNGDGKTDMAVANSNNGGGGNTVSVFFNKGDGTFTGKADYTTGSNPYGVAIGDLNGDGKADMAVANNILTSVSVFINTGVGNFAAKQDYTTGGGSKGVAIGDLNGDGKADMAVVNSGPETVSVFINTGNGTFAPKADHPTGNSPYGVAIGDLNGDGKGDLAVVNNASTSNSVSVLLNQTQPILFAQAVTGRIGIGISSTPSATFDVRGTLQLNAGTLAVASISGKTSFAALVANNDGVGDLFTASASGTNKFVIKNNGTIIAPQYATCTLKTDVNGLFTCGVDNAGGGSPFSEIAGGIIVPNNLTEDFLFGGQASTSATFHLYGSARGGTSPVASIAANTSFAGFVIDQRGLGDVFTASTAGITRFTIQKNGFVSLGQAGIANGGLFFNSTGAGISAPSIMTNSLGDLILSAPQANATVQIGSGNGNIGLSLSNVTDFLIADKTYTAGGSYSGSDFQFKRVITGGANALTGAVLSVTDISSGTTTIAPDLILGNAAPTSGTYTGNLLRLQVNGQDRFVVGSTGTQPVASISGKTSYAAFVTNNDGVGDLFTASASGTNKFVIKGNGSIVAPTYQTCTLKTDTNGLFTCGSDNTGGVNWWNQLAGVLSPVYINNDFALGGTATSSAKFSYTGIQSGQTIASVSGQLIVMPNNGWGGNASIAGQLTLGAISNATIQTVRNQILTIGGNTTGTINIKPSNFSNVNITAGDAGLLTLTGGATSDQTGGTIVLNESSIDITGGGGSGLGGSFGGSITINAGSGNGDPNGNINIGTVNGSGSSLISIGTGTMTDAISLGRSVANLTIFSPTIFSGITTDITTGTNENLAIIPNGTGKIGLFTTAPLATLDVRPNNSTGGTIAIASVSGTTSFATLVANNDGVGDIFAASKAGGLRFRIGGNGALQATAYQTCTLKTDSTGLFTCGSDNGLLSDQFWSHNLGALFPNNSTEDFLIGGQSTASADFSITGIARPDNQVNASLSGQLIVMANNGWGGNATISGALTLGAFSNATIQTTKNQLLTIGGNSTGNIAISPLNGGAGSLLTVNALTTTLAGTTTLNGTSLTTINGGATAIDFTEFDVSAADGSVTINDTGNAGQVSIEGSILDIDSLTFVGAGSILSAGGGGLTLDSASNTLTIAATDTTLSATGLTTVTLGTSATINAGATALNLQAEGTPDVNIAGGSSTTGCTILNASGNLSCSGTITSNGTVLSNFWQRNNGALAPVNITDDLLVGGISSASADFAITGIARPDNQVNASLSGQLIVMANNGWGGNASISADLVIGAASNGRIQTTRNQLLTIGGNSTGNIAISPLNGGAGSLLTVNALTTTLAGTTTLNATSLGTLNTAATLTLGNTTALTASTLATITSAASLGITATTLTLGNGSTATIQTTTNGLTLDSGSNTLTIAATDTVLTTSLTSMTTGAAFTINGTSYVRIGDTAAPGSATGDDDLFVESDLEVDGVIYAEGTIDTLFTGNNAAVYGTVTTGVLASATTSTSNLCLVSGATTPTWASCNSSGIDVFWNQTAGALYPNNSTVDFLFGSQASASARFKLTANNLGAGTLGVASISGQTSFATLVVNNDGVGDIFAASKAGGLRFRIGGNGVLQATAYQTCTLKTDSTGLFTCGTDNTGTGGFESPFRELTGAIVPLNSTLDFFIGGQSTASADFAILNVAKNQPLATISGQLSVYPQNGWGGNASISADLVIGALSNARIQTTKNQLLTIGGNSTGNISLIPNNGTGGAVNISGIVNISGTAGTGLSFTNTGLITDLSLQQTETIDNNVDNTINLGFGAAGGILLLTSTTNSVINASVRLDLQAEGTPDVNIAGGSSTTGCTILNASGNLSCSGTITSNGTVLSNFWQRNNGALAPVNITDDLLVGGISSASADFSITGIARPDNQVNASLSGQLIVMANNGWGGNATISGALTLGAFSNATIQTTKNQLLTIGGNSTGNIAISPLNGGAGSLLTVNALTTTLAGTTTLNGTSLTTINGGATAIDFTEFDVSAADGSVTINDTGNAGQVSIEGSILDIDSLTFVGAGSILSAGGGGLTLDSASNTLTIAATDTTLSATGLTTVTLGTSATINAGATALNLQAEGTPDVNIAGGSSTTGCTILNASGNLSCSGTITSNGTVLSNFWQRNNGALAPVNITDDLLVGGISSASADFAITGIARPDNQVNASLSGQLIVMANNGWGGNATISGALTLGAFSNATIQTTKNQLLTIGGNSTGNIAISPLNGGAGSLLTVNALTTTLAGTTTLNGTSLTTINGGATAIDFTEFDVSAADGSVTINDTGNAGQVSIEGSILDIDSLTFVGAGSILSAGGGGLTLDSASNTLTIAATDTTLSATGLTTVTLGTSATINAGATALNLQAEGTPDVNIAGGSSTTGCTILNASGNLSCSGTITSNGTVLSNFWQRNNGALAPVNITDDLLVGGISTASAKFSITGISSLTNQVNASLSGQLIVMANNGWGGNASISADLVIGAASNGRIQTTRNQALTIGGNTTGGILINQGTNTVAEITIGGTGQTGTLTLGSSSGTNSVLIANGAGATTLNLANVQVGGAVNIGAAMTGGTISIGGTGLQTGTITFGGGTGAQIVNLGTGGTGVKTVNLGTGTAANIISIGTGQTAGSISLGTAMTGGTISIGGTGLQTGTITFGGGTGAQIVNLGTGGTGVKTVNLGTGTAANIISIGTGQTAGSISLGTAMTGGTISIGGTGLQTGTIDIGIGTGAQTINFGTGGTGAKAINIGTGAINNTLIIGSVTTTAATTLRAGTGDLTLSSTDQLFVNSSKVAGGTTTEALSVKSTANLGDADEVLQIGDSAADFLTILGSGNVGIGTIAPLVTFDVRGNIGTLAVASISGRTSFAALVANNDGVGDLFSASSSGTNKFSVQRNGMLLAPTYQTCTLKTDTNGLFTCGTDNTGSGVNWWNQLAGLLSPVNINNDFAIGGTATSTAKFSFTGVKTGQTIASVSGQLIVMANNGWGGQVGIGTTNPGAKLDIAETKTTSTRGIILTQFSADTLGSRINLFKSHGSSSTAVVSGDTLGLVNVGGFDGSVYADGGQFSSVATENWTSSAHGTKLSFLVTPNSSTTNSIAVTIDQNSNVGIGTTSPLSLLHLSGGNTGGRAALIVDQTGASANDIFTASASGVPQFKITNAGSVYAKSFYDLDNSAYFLDPAATSLGLNIAGDASLSGKLNFNGTLTNYVNVLNSSNLNFAVSPSGVPNPLGGLLEGSLSGNAVGFSATGQTALGTGIASYGAMLTSTVNGNLFLYTLGGSTSATADTNIVQKSRINTSANVETWSNPLNLVRDLSQHASAIANNKYLYTLGGNSNGANQTEVERSTLGADGIPGAFAATTNGLPQARFGLGAFTINIGGSTYLFAIGGRNGNTVTTTVQRSTLTAAGDTAAFTTAGQTQLPTAIRNFAVAGPININGTNYVYFVGGNTTAPSNTIVNTVYKATIDATGNVTAITSTGQGTLPVALENASAQAISIGSTTYLFVQGGDTGAAQPQSATYQAVINSNGSVGAFGSANQSGLTTSTTGPGSVALYAPNGLPYIYVAGGSPGFKTTVLRSRISISNIATSMQNTGSVGIGLATNSASFILQVAGNLGPDIDNVFTLGASSSGRWNSAYLGPNSLHIQCLTTDGCGQNLDWSIATDTTTGTLGIGANLNSGSTPAFNITQGGNVGIGTTTPATALDVVSAGDTNVRIKSTATGANTVLTFVSRVGSVDKTSTITNDWNGGLVIQPTTGAVSINTINNTYGNNLTVAGKTVIGSGSYLTTGAPTNGLLVEGNVGIGTTTPLSKLDVRGQGIFGVAAASYAAPIASNAAEFNLSSNSLVTIGESISGDAHPAVTLYRTSAGFRVGTAARIYLASSNFDFRIQQGTNNTNYGAETYTDRLVINSSGNVGINSAPPAGNWLYVDSAGTDNSIIGRNTGGGIGVDGFNNSSGYGVYGSNTSTGYGVYCFATAANKCGGIQAWFNASDRKLKENIAPINNALTKVLNLQGVTYNLKSDPLRTPQMGFIAQDVLPYVPEVVAFDENSGYYGMQTSQLTALLVNAMQEQQAQIASLSASLAGVSLTSTGDLSLVDQNIADTGFTIPHYFTLNDALGNPINRVGAFAELAVAKLRVGFIDARQISTQSLSVVTENISIAGQSLRNYIASIVSEQLSNIQNLTSNNIVSPIASINVIHSNLISPIGSDSKIALKLSDTKFEILNTKYSTGSAVTSFDNLGNATFSGTLRAQKIIADSIEGLNIKASSVSANYITNNYYTSTPSASENPFPTYTASLSGASDYISVAPFSSEFAYVENLNASYASFNQGLSVFGPTTLSDTSVIGQLSVNGSLILADNSINVLGSDLNLQPLRQGGLSIMAGLIYIDTNGNVTFEKDATVKGTLYANIISPIPGNDLALETGNSKLEVRGASNSAVLTINTFGDLVASGAATFSKLNLGLAAPALALSPTEVIATGSAGTATINAGRTQMTINNKLVTQNSLIYITPATSTNQPLFLLRQEPNVSFTVGIENPVLTPIQFNWIIVN